MANPPRPKKKPRVSKPLFPGRDKKRYETWKRYRPGAGAQREGYHRARSAIKKAEQRGKKPSPWDRKIVSEYKPETAQQRQGKIDRFGNFLQDAATHAVVEGGTALIPGMLPLKVKKWLTKAAKYAGAGAAGGALGAVAQRKKGGQVKKSTVKKRKRAALRGHRSELRGG
jgi:hypothetical protein